LLIDDEEIGDSALSLLRSANYTDGAVWSAGRWRETFFAKILYRGMEVPPSTSTTAHFKSTWSR